MAWKFHPSAQQENSGSRRSPGTSRPARGASGQVRTTAAAAYSTVAATADRATRTLTRHNMRHEERIPGEPGRRVGRPWLRDEGARAAALAVSDTDHRARDHPHHDH